MSTLRLPEGYVRNLDPVLYDDVVVGGEWQPQVYQLLRREAKDSGCTRIIDLGCGYARKLVPLADDFEVIGVDRPEVADRNRELYPNIEWIGVDFEVTPLPELPVDSNTCFVCSDVIEHLVYPLGVLDGVKHYLSQGAAFYILSTPDRPTFRGPSDLGPPANEAHVQEWSHEEFNQLLEDADLNVAWSTLTRSQTGQDIFGTITVRVDP